MLVDDEKWFKVSLRLSGDRLPLEEIGGMLGITPSSFEAKGQHIRDNPKYAKYQTNLWIFEFTKDSSIPFEEQLEELSELLSEKKTAIDEILSIDGVDGELFLGFSSACGQGGAYFSSEIMKWFGDLKISICIDLYPPTIDEECDEQRGGA